MLKVQEESILHLVIGENIPDDAPDYFHKVLFYVRDKDNNLKLYADIYLPYVINHARFWNISEDDPRYIFEEGYDFDTQGCKYTCMIKPFGDMKGVYRTFDMQLIKIQSIEPLCELGPNAGPHTLAKNII